ncbi:MAG: C1 family peptidase [Legionella sp.]|uniref:C1 family peptidase n=1 Tax=Legionella sp. TaxID=459 RepID=UPI00283D872C|nr:C1 family peptidase [Legionella sp.]
MQFKQMTSTLMQVSILALSMTGTVFSGDVTVVGSIKQTLKQSHTTPSAQYGVINKDTNEKVIQLLHVELSEEAKNHLINQAQALAHPQTMLKADASAFPARVQLGMSNVPVLDQGVHGTCVTFAVTGVIDAALAKGDYISQVCNLQLGNYLEKFGYGSSGWDGSYAEQVISQIQQFGIVNKEKERTIGCGGYKEYPTYLPHNSALIMDPAQYIAMRELVFGNQVNWFNVLQENNSELTLNEVKQALNAGDRLVFGVLLPRTDLGLAGALAKHKAIYFQDTWVVTPEIINGLESVEAGHEMIITGYDDNAVAIDDKGQKHQGLLKIRNSWGRLLGDAGEFYMSYDYFKLLVIEVSRISPAH